ncbi:MAG: hypothetical protein M3141_06440 [Actinomycetota bacterium]|nr:hypothetical protein [Actinomycetota bacterium]
MTPQVELVVNAYERTYRDVLGGGLFTQVEADNRFRFAQRTALVNNVLDRADADRRARELLATGEIDRYAFVEDRLPDALSATGLSPRDLGRIPHYSDAPLVGVTLEGPPWVLYWDAGIRMSEPGDWITPSVAAMGRDSRILIANPRWSDPTLERETIEHDGDFALGHGFSDQVFLARRDELARPIYGQRCLSSWRYPLAHVGRVFEARVDSWMRHHDRLRATYVRARYVHPPGDAGLSYPDVTARERLRWYRNQAALALLGRSPWKPYCCRYM